MLQYNYLAYIIILTNYVKKSLREQRRIITQAILLCEFEPQRAGEAALALKQSGRINRNQKCVKPDERRKLK